MINGNFPDIKNIYSFVDVFTGIKKSINDFMVLRDKGLKRLYLGVESGNPELMSFLNKHQSNSDIIDLFSANFCGSKSGKIFTFAFISGDTKR